MTDSGNIHLYAAVDGQERRRAFTKKNEQYEAVLETLKMRLSREDQEELLDRYFRS